MLPVDKTNKIKKKNLSKPNTNFQNMKTLPVF